MALGSHCQAGPPPDGGGVVAGSQGRRIVRDALSRRAERIIRLGHHRPLCRDLRDGRLDLYAVSLHGSPGAGATPLLQDGRRVRDEGAPGDDRADPAAGLRGVLETAAVRGPCGRAQAGDAAARPFGLGQFPDRPYREQRAGLRLMTATNKTVIAGMTFTVSYAVIYVICTEFNLPLATYHPVIGEIDFLWKPERRGPAMYWYGWMLSALIGAAALAAIASVTPETWLQRAITFGAVAAVGYLLIYTLALFVY